MIRKSRAIFGRMAGVHGAGHVPLRQLISWGEHLKVDQPSIDAQHEEIFKIALEAADLWRNRGGLEQSRAIAGKLYKALEGHFRYEERQLEEVGYPKLAEHRAEHQAMLEELQAIRDRFEKMADGAGSLAPGFLIHNYVLGLTVGHIHSSDMDYCVFAREAAKKKAEVWPPAKCPFCDSTQVSTFECDVETWAASCSSCKAIGPFSSSGSEAVLRWNRALKTS